MKIGILTPDYFPPMINFWVIAQSDITIFLDSLSLPKRHSVSRMKLLTPHGAEWFSVPVKRSSRPKQKLKDAQTEETVFWRKKHLKRIKHQYCNALYFDEIFPLIEELLKFSDGPLASMNCKITQLICRKVQIPHSFVWSSTLVHEKTEASFLDHLSEKYSADTILSTAASEAYFKKDEGKVNILYADDMFVHPVYQQDGVKKFHEGLSILDALFHCGKQKVHSFLIN